MQSKQVSNSHLKFLGYTKLVLLSEANLEYAVREIHPGKIIPRRLYPQSISPRVDAWPVIYQDEDLKIIDIP